MQKLRVAVVVLAIVGALTLSPGTTGCDGLGGLVPAPRLPLSVTDLGTGAQRVESPEGGWSLVVPSSWSVRPGLPYGTGFGQASISSYNPDGMKYKGLIGPGFLPASTGVRLQVEVWANPGKLDPARYASTIDIFNADRPELEAGEMVLLAGQRAFRAVLKEAHLVGQDANGWIFTRQSRLLWVVPTLRSDRVLVLYAWPRENQLIATADTIVSSLALFTPVSARAPVTYTHDQVLRKWRYDANGAIILGRRSEAKLMTNAQFSAAIPGIFNSWGLDRGKPSLRIDEDPDKLLWVVAVAGGDLGFDRLAARKYTWIFYTAQATAETLPIDVRVYGTEDPWPTPFDGLPDLCR